MGDSNLPMPKIILAGDKINFSPTDESSAKVLKDLPPGKHTVIAEFEVPPPADGTLPPTQGPKTGFEASAPSPHTTTIGRPVGAPPRSIFDGLVPQK